MKLTNEIRDRMLRSIFADVPRRNFDVEAEAIVLPAALDRLPPSVRKIYDNKSTRDYINFGLIYTGCGGINVRVPTNEPDAYRISDKVAAIGEEALAKFQDLCREKREEKSSIDEMQMAVAANLKACRTTLQVAERFPEFVKYLPPERADTPNLPATNDLVDRLRGLGWTDDAQNGEQA